MSSIAGKHGPATSTGAENVFMKALVGEAPPRVTLRALRARVEQHEAALRPVADGAALTGHPPIERGLTGHDGALERRQRARHRRRRHARVGERALEALTVLADARLPAKARASFSGVVRGA